MVIRDGKLFLERLKWRPSPLEPAIKDLFTNPAVGNIRFVRDSQRKGAYGKDYSCPLPPEENRLPVAIRAGEKAYPLAAFPAPSTRQAAETP
ncbi:MAG: DUF1684 domain-containing protein [Acidobacteria bacterium]|nr:DUF1684 domain-containing protein [Acidobacteriota bacterium]